MKNILSFFRRHPLFSNFLLFLLCAAAAFVMRTHNYNREAEAVAKIIRDAPAPELSFVRKFFPAYHRNFMPYTIECAMMYSYTQEIAAGKKIGSRAGDLHGLEDIAPYRQMIMGLEWFLGWGWRIRKALFGTVPPMPGELQFQDNPDLANFVPVQLRLWISLSSGFLFLLLLVLGCSRKQALFGGIFHAVAIAAIARSTGQDIIRGNFAMPFITGFLLMLYSVYKKPAAWKYLLLFLAAAGAFSFWDLSLGMFSAFALFELVRYVIYGKVSPARRNAWILTSAAIVLSALTVPFHQTYLVIMSPLITVILPSLLFFFFMKDLPQGKRILYVLLTAGCLYGIWHVGIRSPEYLSSYSHFSELTKAKILFRNVKPKDPARLSYDARMMWTPAMHSADWKILKTMFPAIGLFIGTRGMQKTLEELISLPLALGGYCFLLLLFPLFSRTARRLRRTFPKTLFFHAFTVIFTVGFIYVVRYHEFLIFFLAVSLTLLLKEFAVCCSIAEQTALRNGGKGKLFHLLKRVPAVFAVCVLLLESTVSLFGNRVYSHDVYLRQTAALIRWLRTEPSIRGRCVIADFTVGPMLKCYAGCAIAMQPQFGLERIRKPTEAYLDLLYHGREKDLAAFCSRLKADFLLHHAGYLGQPHIYSLRYIANAVKIDPDSPVNLMRYAPERLRWFCKIEPPAHQTGISGVYTLFRVITPEGRIRALRLAFRAEQLYRKGRKEEAGRLAKQAFLADPLSPRAKRLCIRIYGRIPRCTIAGGSF